MDTKLRWRVEHRDAEGAVKNILETVNHVEMERQLSAMVKNEWLLSNGDSIHITRKTED